MTVILCKRKYFFFREDCKKQENDAGINFVIFLWSRNIKGFVKTYLHRQSRFYNSLHEGNFRNV